MKKFFLRSSFLFLLAIGGLPSQTFAFSDVNQQNPHYEAIEFLKEAGIANGYADGTFKPDQLINRAEFTKIVLFAKYYGEIEEFKKGNDHAGEFTDVPNGVWFNGYVWFAKQEGIINGYGDGSFGGEKNINSAEASKIIVNTLIGKTESSKTEQWWTPFFTRLENLGVKKYDPTHSLTRGEMADMIWKVSGRNTFDKAGMYFQYPSPFGAEIQTDEGSGSTMIGLYSDSQNPNNSFDEPEIGIISLPYSQEIYDGIINSLNNQEEAQQECDGIAYCDYYELGEISIFPMEIDRVSNAKTFSRTMITKPIAKQNIPPFFSEQIIFWEKDGRINIIANGGIFGRKTAHNNFFIDQAFGLILQTIQTTPQITVSTEETAQCLKDKKAIFYGANWCSHCKAQKALFGDSLPLVNYIDCANETNLQLCQEKNITGYPTWVFADGSTLSGKQSLNSLYQKAGCRR